MLVPDHSPVSAVSLHPCFIPSSCLRSRRKHLHQNVFHFSLTNLAHIGACLLLFFINPAFGSDDGDNNEGEQSHFISSQSSKAVAITLGVTIPCALIAGILWCYCMSKVCKTDQASLARPKLSRAHTASRELISAPNSPQPKCFMVDNYASNYKLDVSHETSHQDYPEYDIHPHCDYDIEASNRDDESFNDFNDIPIHRYHSDSLEEVSGIPIEGGVHMESFDSDEDVRPHLPPAKRYNDSDTSSEDMPPVQSHQRQNKCKSLDDIRKKHHRKVPPKVPSSTSNSEPRITRLTLSRHHYDTDSLSSGPKDSDMDDSDVLPERHKKNIRRQVDSSES